MWELKCDVACPQGNGYPSRQSAALAVCYDVADPTSIASMMRL